MATCIVIVEAPCCGVSEATFDSDGAEQAAGVDPVVLVELAVLDGEEGATDVLGDLGEGDRLAVLALEQGDQVAVGVVARGSGGPAAGSAGKRQRLTLPGVGDAPHPRGDGDDDGAEQQRRGQRDDAQSGDPGDRAHRKRLTVWRLFDRGSADGSGHRRDHVGRLWKQRTGRATGCRRDTGAVRRESLLRRRSSRNPRQVTPRSGTRRAPDACAVASQPVAGEPIDPRPDRSASGSRSRHRTTPRGGWNWPARPRTSATPRSRCPTTSADQLAPVPALMAAADATTTCASVRSCSTTTTGTRSCWPRSWRRWTCCPAAGVEIGLGAGWMASDYEQSGIPYDPPGVRIDRLEEALAVIKGALADGPVLVRRRALHDHATTTASRSPCSVPTRRC